jgi:hypothetical protein
MTVINNCSNKINCKNVSGERVKKDFLPETLFNPAKKMDEFLYLIGYNCGYECVSKY